MIYPKLSKHTVMLRVPGIPPPSPLSVPYQQTALLHDMDEIVRRKSHFHLEAHAQAPAATADCSRV